MHLSGSYSLGTKITRTYPNSKFIIFTVNTYMPEDPFQFWKGYILENTITFEKVTPNTSTAIGMILVVY